MDSPAEAVWITDVAKHGACITPYGRGREWAESSGPYGDLNCGEAIEAWGWLNDSKEERAFLRGAKSRQAEMVEELYGDNNG